MIYGRIDYIIRVLTVFTIRIFKVILERKLMNNEIYNIEYDRWGKIIIKSQLIIACIVCVIEIINNIILYATKAPGYGPDEIMGTLFRYLFITSVINFGLVLLSRLAEEKVKSETTKRYLLMLFTILICTDVAFSHYQFSVCLAIFVIPIIISILYEDLKLSVFTLIVSLLGELVAVISRASDPIYNKDIGPEAVIAFSFPLCVFVFSKIISDTLGKRRNSLKEAVISAEKANASAERMELSMNMLETLAGTIDAKDKYTNGHSLRVSIYATKLAEALGWDEKRISILRYEALLHDIGKIGVPDTILNKPAKLNDTEFALIKSHVVVGSDILRKMVVLPGAAEVARYHHERYDGKGYPDGISGADIPIDARIVCIADSYDAMNSNRIYRKALTPEVIRAELIGGRGTQFDPELLDVFVELLDSNKLEISDALAISKEDKEQQDVMDDIKKLLYRLNDVSVQYNTINNFDQFYLYMKNIGHRYNRSVEVLEINIERVAEGKTSMNEEEVSDILSVAIQKNIRAVDVYHKFSEIKHMIILLDAGLDNVDVVIKRIQFDYDANVSGNEFRLAFSVNEHMEKPRRDQT